MVSGVAAALCVLAGHGGPVASMALLVEPLRLPQHPGTPPSHSGQVDGPGAVTGSQGGESHTDGTLLLASGSWDRTVRVWGLCVAMTRTSGRACEASSCSGGSCSAPATPRHTTASPLAVGVQHTMVCEGAGAPCSSSTLPVADWSTGRGTLLWASRAGHQVLDARGVVLDGTQGLALHQRGLLAYYGADTVTV